MSMPSSSAKLLRLAVAIIVAGSLLGCGDRRVPWRDEMKRWFNNASVNPPEPEPRDWSYAEWESFMRRIGFADAAVLGTMKIVNTFSLLHTPQRVALSFRPIELLHGSLDGLTDDDGTLSLILEQGTLDFHAAVISAKRIPGHRYLLFLKEKPRRVPRPPSGWEGSLWRPLLVKKDFRWALYRPERPLLIRVRTMYGWLHRR